MNEFLSLQKPFSKENKNPVLIMYEVVNNNSRPSIHNKTPQILESLIKQCWETEFSKRPTFKQIIDVLTSPDVSESSLVSWPFDYFFFSFFLVLSIKSRNF